METPRDFEARVCMVKILLPELTKISWKGHVKSWTTPGCPHPTAWDVPILGHMSPRATVVRAHAEQCRPLSSRADSAVDFQLEIATWNKTKQNIFIKRFKILPSSNPPNNRNPASPRDEGDVSILWNGASHCPSSSSSKALGHLCRGLFLT